MEPKQEPQRVPEAFVHWKPVEASEAEALPGDHLSCSVVVLENASQSLPGHDGDSVVCGWRERCDELVSETLVVPFCVIVNQVFGYSCSQVSLTEWDNAVETLPA